MSRKSMHKSNGDEASVPNLPALPKGWSWASLRQLGLLDRGRSRFRPRNAAHLYCGPYPFIQTGDIRHANTYVRDFSQTYSEAGLSQSRLWPKGTMCITIAANIAETAILGFDACFPDSVVGFIPHSEAVSVQYVEYFFRTIQQQLEALAPATAQKNINLETLAKVAVPVPPPAEQRRIVAKVEELFSDLDAGVAALERAKANLKRYRAAVLKAAVEGKLTEAWRAEHPKNEPASKLLERILIERRRKWEADQLTRFAAAAGNEPPKNWRQKYVEPTPPDTNGLPELPDGWCWASVEQTSEVQGGIQKQPKRAPRENSYPFLRVANVHRNRLELDEVHQIELFGNELERLRLQTDDLLVVEGNGSKTEIGRSAIWKGEIENCVHQNHIIRVRFLAGSSRYLNAYWNSPSGNGRVMEQAASTSGLYTLSVTKVCALPFPVAPLTEQQEIVAEVEQRLSVIAAAEAEIAHGLVRAARLRQSILKQAFEGKLVPQDPKDEPASVLLERLRKIRSAHEENGKAMKMPRTRGRRCKVKVSGRIA